MEKTTPRRIHLFVQKNNYLTFFLYLQLIADSLPSKLPVVGRYALIPQATCALELTRPLVVCLETYSNSVSKVKKAPNGTIGIDEDYSIGRNSIHRIRIVG